MILEKQKEANVLTEGVSQSSIGMSLDLDSAQVLMQMLSKNLYSDSVGSTIRECASNALDSHRRAGSDRPIIVSFKRNNQADTYEFAEEFIRGFKLDEDTYYILTGEETVAVVGKPKSKKYGEFWSMLVDDDLDGAGEIFDQMDIDSGNAPELEEVRKALKERDDDQIAVVDMTFNAPIVSKDKNYNKTFSGPYKSKATNLKAQIHSQAQWNPREIAPNVKALTMFQSQIIGQGMDKFNLQLTVPYTGDRNQLVADLESLVNKTFSSEQAKVQGLGKKFGAVFTDTNQLKNLLLAAVKTVQVK